MNTAEAKVLITDQNGTRDAMDFDPITLPVLMYVGDTEIPCMTDVTTPELVRLLDAIIELETATPLGPNLPTYSLVWSDFGLEVRGNCVDCDDLFHVVEGMPAGEGIVCGCIDD